MATTVITAAQRWGDADAILLKQPPKPGLGIQFHGLWDHYWSSGGQTGQYFAHLNSIADSGATLIRVDVGFSTAMPTQTFDPNQYYLKRLTQLLADAAVRDLKVLVTVHQAPEWSRPGTGTNVKQYPTNLNAWRDFMRNMASTFGSRVYAWQVWNEPNIRDFSGVTGDPNTQADRYVPVLKAASEGIRSGNPGALVVIGGPSQSDNEFIDACYYRGAKDYFDIMSWHPYQGDQTKPPLSTDRYDKGRATFAPRILEHMAYWGDATKPIWWTEFGVSVHSNDGIPASQPWRFGVPTNEQSAEHLIQYFELAKRYPQVEYGVVYVAHKTGDVHQAGYSIMAADGTPLPQLDALKGYTLGT
jgi:Cellulase (glycosyl hydrolase family 5)